MIERRPSRKEDLKQRRDLNRQQEAAAISRRTLVKKLFIAGGSLAAIGVTGAAWHVGSRLLDQSPKRPANLTFEQTREQHLRDESILNQSITGADDTMSRLEQLIRSKASAFTEAQTSPILQVFDLYRLNKQNPNRNSYTFLLEDLAQRGPDALKSPRAFFQTDPRYFFMRLLEGRVNVAGTFNPSARTLHLSEKVQGDNLFDGLVIEHETEHALQDAFIRQFLKGPELKSKYDAFYSGGPGTKPRIMIEFEYQAYAKEIESLNILSDNRLKTRSISGIYEPDHYLEMLNARRDQFSAVEALVLIGASYYQSNSRIDTYTTGFQQSINNVYRDNGYTLYRLTSPETFEVRPI